MQYILITFVQIFYRCFPFIAFYCCCMANFPALYELIFIVISCKHSLNTVDHYLLIFLVNSIIYLKFIDLWKELSVKLKQ